MKQRRWPRHMQGWTKEKVRLRRRLRSHANNVRAYYGEAIFLVGSALLDFNGRPRDWDWRVVLPDADFHRRYGITAKDWMDQGSDGTWSEGRWRWSDDCVKRSKEASGWTGVNVDFQTMPALAERVWGWHKKPRFQLDSRPRGG